MTRVTIHPCTRFAATWIAAHAREADKAELLASLSGDLRMAGIVCNDTSPQDLRWVAKVDGELAVAFGISWNAVVAPTTGHVWAYGTPRMARAIPAVSRHFVQQTLQMAEARGITRLEVRSIVGHDIAHRWLERLGATRTAELAEYGTGGETFVLYEWTRTQWLELVADPAKQSPWLRRALKTGMIREAQEQAA